MEVRKLDIIESILVGFFSFSYIRAIFTWANTIPCLLFSIGVAVVFLIFYHEKYIGVVLNVVISLFWTVILITILSLFSIFNGKKVVLFIMAVAILYISLCIHGINIAFWRDRKAKFDVSSSEVKLIFEEYHQEHEQFCYLKNAIEPILDEMDATSDIDGSLKTTTAQIRASILSVNDIDQKVISLSKKKKLTLDEFNLIVDYTRQLRQLNARFSSYLSSANGQDETYEQEKENNYTNTQARYQETSYFNGCNTEESLKTRYRDLCKVYHPDMGNGSMEEFTKIKNEYDILKERFK
ncbi:MAG: J domain-containing protein [Lachnospiraceae bacterium]|nr:J domain-containing protein [Lachnospiraceae bacterium]